MVPRRLRVAATPCGDARYKKLLSKTGLMRAQAAVAKHDEFHGNVAFVGTRDFYRPPEESPSSQGYHWNSNAETYYLIGTAMGEAMKKLCGK